MRPTAAYDGAAAEIGPWLWSRLTPRVQPTAQSVLAMMWGASEFHVTGTLKDWDITDRVGEIRVPTLVVGGRYDEATPALTEALRRSIAASECVIFENSAHVPHLEETERYLQVLTKFLDRVESPASLTQRRAG